MPKNTTDPKNKVSVAAVKAPRDAKVGQPLVCKKDSDGNFNCQTLYKQKQKK